MVGEQRHDRERQPGREDRAAAVEPLYERRTAAPADVVAAGDEREAGSEADDRAAEQTERRFGCRKRHRVADRDEREPDEGGVAGPEAVGRASAGNLHPHVDDELHRREETDRREPDAVRVRQPRRDGAERSDVPAHRHADRNAADGRARCDP